MNLSTVPGAPNWIELFTADTDRARAFYGELFGWTVEESGPEFGNYALFLRDGEPIGGLMRNEIGVPDMWSVYLHSADAAATVAAAREHGGQVVVEPMQVADRGHMAVVADPSGAAIGVWQPLEFEGIATRAEDRAPSWFELHTTDYAAAVPFYREVFGWSTHEVSDAPEFRYTTLGKDDDALAGIMDATGHFDGQPSAWVFYVQVDDADAALARALELGGSRLPDTGPHDTPYGRLTVLADPAGVPLSLVGPTRA